MATRSSGMVCADQTDGEVMQAKSTTQRKRLAEDEARKRHKLRGGFECVFVKDPSEHGVQTECSICLCVLREPYLLDCCGYSFCKSCIEPIKSEKKPCPLCAVQFTTCIADKRLQRTLNDLQVYCAQKDEGCEWVGQLVNLEQHLNANPLLENDSERLSGCQLTSLECQHCGDSCFRRDLVDHETSVCSQRPYSCEYCRDFKSTFEDVTSNHWSVCPDRPVPCPNGCGSSPELKQLKDHLKECPLEVVECAFRYAGCIEKLPRKEMPEHITQSLAIHMSLQATNHQREQKKLLCQISELQQLHQQSRMEVAELRRENRLLSNKVQQIQQEFLVQMSRTAQEIKTAQDQRLKGHLGTLRGEIKNAQAETKQEITEQVKSVVVAVRGHIAKEIKTAQVELKQEITKQVKSDVAALHSHVGVVPFIVTMPGFNLKKRLNSSWYSPSFYTHPRGYKVCLRVYANGYGAGANSHVSVFVHMMKGEYDDELKWPFRGDITIQLLHTSKDEGHYKIIDITDRSNDFGGRVLEREKSTEALGFPDFIHHKHLTPYYLKDDCLKLCVIEVIIKSV